MDQRFVAAGTLAALVTLVTILTLRRLAPRLGLVDKPNERKQHRGHVPLVGGVCFVLGTLIGLLYYGRLDVFSVYVLAAGAMVFLLGVIDDIEDMSAWKRLLVQACVAGAVIAASGIYIDGLGNLSGHEFRLHAIGIPLTIIAVIGLINAFNMLDGIDGLAASMALVSIFFILVFASARWPAFGLALVLQMLSLALVPYLFVNLGWPDGRKIFMGDAGSTSIGFLVAWGLVYLSHRSVGEIRPVDVLWCVAIPVMDTAAVTARRIRKRCSPFMSDRRHLHHRLLTAGFSPRETLMLIVSAGVLMGAAGYALRHAPEAVSLGAFIAAMVGYVWKQPHLVELLRSRRAASAATAAVQAPPAGGAGIAVRAPAGGVPRSRAGGQAREGGRAARRAAGRPGRSPRILVPGAAVQRPATMVKALCVLGASSNDITMAPIMQQISRDARFESMICVATHDRGTTQALRMFGIAPDLDLDVDDPAGDPDGSASATLGRMKQVLDEFRPDVVLIHGDTSTALAVAMAARYEKVPVAHMDTWLPYGSSAPWWSDQANHRLISTLTSLHFAPTKTAGRMLASYGVPEDRVTVVDRAATATLRSTVEVIRNDGDVRRDLAQRFPFLREGSPLLLVTDRSREETYSMVVRRALRTLATHRPDLDIVCPATAFAAESQAGPSGIHPLQPLDYLAFAYLLDAAHLVLTDSVDAYDEAVALGKPAVLVRDQDVGAQEPHARGRAAASEEEIVDRVMSLLANGCGDGPAPRATDAARDGVDAYLRIVEALADLPGRARQLAA